MCFGGRNFCTFIQLYINTFIHLLHLYNHEKLPRNKLLRIDLHVSKKINRPKKIVIHELQIYLFGQFLFDTCKSILNLLFRGNISWLYKCIIYYFPEFFCGQRVNYYVCFCNSGSFVLLHKCSSRGEKLFFGQRVAKIFPIHDSDFDRPLTFILPVHFFLCITVISFSLRLGRRINNCLLVNWFQR